MYEKQTWVSGEIVTEGKLNHMEEGINSALTTFKINVTYDYETKETTCDKTFAQIKEAYDNNFSLEIGELDAINGIYGRNETVSFPLVEHYQGEQEEDEYYFFRGINYLYGRSCEIQILINSNGVVLEYVFLCEYNPAFIEFEKSNSEYTIHQITANGNDVTLEEYLDGEFSDIYGSLTVDFERVNLTTLSKTSFLYFELETNVDDKNIYFKNLVINNDGTVTWYPAHVIQD